MNNTKKTLKFTLIFISLAGVAAVFGSFYANDAAQAQIGFPGQPTSQPGSSTPSTTTPTTTAPTQTVTATEEFTFFMNQDRQSDIIKAIEGEAITATPNPMSQTAIYGRGGQFGKTPIQFRYTSKVGENFYYEVSYYCNGSGETSRTKSTDFPSEVRVQVAIPLTKEYVRNGSSVGSGAGRYRSIAEFSSPNESQIRIKKCLPNGIPSPVYVVNFKKLSAEAKARWGDLRTTAVAQAADNASDGDEGGSLSDCDAKFLNPLSWIICPIIDLGADLSDSMFQNVISPLLSDVPVSTNRTDPVYTAWQGFRLIANIMLVGSMLAIVYAQTRGGDK